MKFLNQLLIILVCAHTVVAQPNLPLELADSLWEVWEDDTRHDTVRLNAIYDYAWDGYLYTQPDSAFYYSQLQYDFAKARNLKTPMANASNTASRMESSGTVDKVNISEFTYELLTDDPDFEFKYRGKIKAKGKGEIEMYFVESSEALTFKTKQV